MSSWTFVLDQPARILVADDDPILREFAIVHLATPVVPVESAADGEDAWARLCAEPFDLLLLDLGMPKLDGFEVLERVRASHNLRHLPVVVLTGREDVVSIDRAFEKGATAFVTKPVNWRQLSHQLRYLLRNTAIEVELRKACERAERLAKERGDLLMRFEARNSEGMLALNSQLTTIDPVVR